MKTPPKKRQLKHWYLFGVEPSRTLICVRRRSWEYAAYLSEELRRTPSCIMFKRVPAVEAYSLQRGGIVSRGFSSVRSDIVHILALHKVQDEFGEVAKNAILNSRRLMMIDGRCSP